MANGKKKNGRKIILLTLILLSVAGLGTAAFVKKREPVTTVQTEPVARRNLTELVTATGKVQPVLQVKISPEVAGEIIELPVKEGQSVKKGDLLVKIKPEYYEAARGSAEASFLSSEADLKTTEAQLAQAELELGRMKDLYDQKIKGASDYDSAKTEREVRATQSTAARHRIENARAALRRAEEDLLKCTIYSPIDGTVAKLNSEVGERVVGTGMMAGTEIMTVADLNEMEARVEVGEVDVPLVKLGQHAKLDVDSFRDRKFSGAVTQIANSAKTSLAGSQQQEATKFEIRIRIADKERFLPGMSVTADVETRYRTNVLTVPIQSVTTRLPKGAKKPDAKLTEKEKEEQKDRQEYADLTKKKEKVEKSLDVVFTVEAGKAKMLPVKRGISDDAYYEVAEGVTEGLEVVSGSYKAIARELEDGKVIKVDNTKKEKGSKTDTAKAN